MLLATDGHSHFNKEPPDGDPVYLVPPTPKSTDSTVGWEWTLDKNGLISTVKAPNNICSQRGLKKYINARNNNFSPR